MLLTEDEISQRIESPMNLLNRLKSATNPHKTSLIPTLPPTANDIINELDDKINNGSIKSKAMRLMNAAMDELKNRLPEVSKPEKLAAIAADMGKVVNGVEQKTSSNDRPTAQIIIYAPQVVLEETFNMVELVE